MFIIQEERIENVCKGEITQHRLNRTNARAKVDAVHQIKPSLFGRPACLVKVKRVWREKLNETSDEDAKAMGFESAKTMLDYMLKEYADKGIKEDTEVWAYEWELEDDPVTLEALQEKWENANAVYKETKNA